jgi:energy-coupling factor transporter ATP-binding protein EcfA2
MLLALTGIGVRDATGRAGVLSGINLTIARGEVIGVAGPNGAGKSTLGLVLAGIERPTEGVMRCAPSLRVGLVVQDPAAQLVAATVAHDVAFALECEQVPVDLIANAVASVLARLGMLHVAWSSPERLSGGQQQRVAVAGQLVRRPDVVVLDEPTAHLDNVSAAEVAAAVAALATAGVAVIWITQRPRELATCTRLVVLDGGRAVFDGPPSVAAQLPDVAHLAGLDGGPVARLAAGLRQRGVEIPAGVVSWGELEAVLGAAP